LSKRRRILAKVKRYDREHPGGRMKSAGANVVVIAEDGNPAHDAPLRRRGVRTVQSLHTCLWPENRPVGLVQRLRLRSFGKACAFGHTVVPGCSEVVSSKVATVAS